MSFYMFKLVLLILGSSLISVHSQANTSTILQLNTPFRTFTNATKCDSYSYYSVYFNHPCNELSISLAVTSGEPTIYVSKKMFPTKSTMTWSSHSYRLYSIIISYYDPEFAPGWFNIGIYNDCSKQRKIASYGIRALRVIPSVFGDLNLLNKNQPDIVYQPISGIFQTISLKSYKYYRFCIATCSNALVTLKSPSAVTSSSLQLYVSRKEKKPTKTSNR